MKWSGCCCSPPPTQPLASALVLCLGRLGPPCSLPITVHHCMLMLCPSNTGILGAAIGSPPPTHTRACAHIHTNTNTRACARTHLEEHATGAGVIGHGLRRGARPAAHALEVGAGRSRGRHAGPPRHCGAPAAPPAGSGCRFADRLLLLDGRGPLGSLVGRLPARGRLGRRARRPLGLGRACRCCRCPFPVLHLHCCVARGSRPGAGRLPGGAAAGACRGLRPGACTCACLGPAACCRSGSRLHPLAPRKLVLAGCHLIPGLACRRGGRAVEGGGGAARSWQEEPPGLASLAAGRSKRGHTPLRPELANWQTAPAAVPTRPHGCLS